MSVAKKGCTCFYLELNLQTQTIKYADSGIGVAYLLREGELTELRDEGGLILGVMEDATYTEGEIQLGKGDVILVGSDGITDIENQDGERYGDDRLKALLSTYHTTGSKKGLKTQVESSLTSFCGSLELPKDDITFLTLEALK